jgi:hypothetical protein
VQFFVCIMYLVLVIWATYSATARGCSCTGLLLLYFAQLSAVSSQQSLVSAVICMAAVSFVTSCERCQLSVLLPVVVSWLSALRQLSVCSYCQLSASATRYTLSANTCQSSCERSCQL